MTMTREALRYMEVRDDSSAEFKKAIDNAVDALMHELRSYGWKLAGDDRAAELEAAIVKYVVTSQV